jgi:TPR repeat protein
MSPELIAALVRRGAAMLAVGDVSAARLLFERAAEGGSAAAALAAGRTYDPQTLAAIGAFGIPADPAAAARWYRRAAELGDAEAEVALRRLGVGPP